jgi:flavin reductase (DIM6/NTAB) family NADH-FMN oxidoreductase RutF
VIEPGQLRRATGHFATGVTVVATRDAAGRPVGTTANAVTSLSLEPPQLLVCLSRASQTLLSIREHRRFAVNVLADHQRELSINFARSGAGASWDTVAHRPGVTHSPVLKQALAVIECEVDRLLDGGDHEIVIGTVVSVSTSDKADAPLLFWRGGYARLEAAA